MPAPYPRANAAVAAADQTGQYMSLLRSADYKKLVSWSGPSALGSSIIGNGAIAGPSGRAAITPAPADVKPIIAGGLESAVVDVEKRALRAFEQNAVIKLEQEAMNWLLANSPSPRYVVSVIASRGGT